ncbi:MAG TPA: 2-hydroxyglutaryl-CoA dehydratase [Hungateiclostridium thermocellum]|uniref:CoA-substrate-specific enzyme activase n=2 Tax=Acetivibrio thermocellus TaxID=1515 RepID=A3DCB3_ACET2|nr:acyl-CoA dehydratase activase [Acetivibrio thermocellus]CDG35031.1 putative CoA-substrate-specific enzyme activase [Acetivibrio thermocellus BC1]ABN51592.1 CoA-substrate-specific enzyme activase [Acetivibrio thermocellus ATCC 27405]ADU74922.1 CoA-substrate-specific enzyme activase [Acetivibrio thermocellus DSM 1313]ALX08882.1 CoA-substrate-specific enzyme activase [Acetivibrio thermocellus AD2]ANV76632.1 CoA-substrate-specific enzyme activase [Acetivibrio thermocellus DSM 2360]
MLKTSYYLGIDVGSVSTNLVVINENDEIVEKLYLRTSGQPINALKNGMKTLYQRLGKDVKIRGVGTTGSGRQLASVIVGADIVKNEITTHAIAAQKLVPEVRTIIEIGGQDSKIIILKNGIIYDFAMNTVCAAGTGSFLDRQAARLEIPIEEFGSFALRSKTPVRIAGRCAVFAESDMIHKQQTGHSVEDIINGLCEALVRNYLNNLAKGKDIEEPIVFQGGVAANVGIVAAFERAIGKKIIIPQHYDVMGAYGAALIAKEEMMKNGKNTNFFGFDNIHNDFRARSIECNGCSNMCEVIEIVSNDAVVACWGDRCGKWSAVKKENQSVG